MRQVLQLTILLLLQLDYSHGEEWDPENTPDLFVTANTFDLIGFVGGGVTMYATVRGDPRPTADDITWIKMQGNMPEDRILITYDLKTNESRIRINELEYDDAGTYYCTAMINGVSKSVSMTLNVVVEPEIFRVTGLMTFKAVGQSVILSVTVNGNPIPAAEDITWAKMDSRSIPMPLSHDRFELNNGNKELTITDLEIADEGWYKCLVKTDEGKAEAPFLLHVLGMRSIEESAVGVVGNSVSMSCAATYVENVYPGTKTTINWYRYEAPDIPLAGSTMESEESSTQASTSVLTLTDLDWTDEGEYFCTSSYPGFPDDSLYNATLNIRGLNSISGTEVEGVLGNQLTMTCVARGDIQATITWNHNDTTTRAGVTTETTYSAPYTTSVLTLPVPALFDQGVYECSIEFDEQTSTITGSTQLNLNYVWRTSGAALGVEDNSATITCSGIGNIAPDSWTWNDPNTTDSSQWSTLQTSADRKDSSVFWTVNRFDAGSYTCTAHYEARGTSTGEVDLTVQYIKTSPLDQTAVHGTDSTLTCVANLAPDSFKWFKETTEMDTPTTSSPNPTTSLLVLSPVDFEHAGSYNCEAVFSGKSAKSLTSTFFVRGFKVHPEDTTTVNMTSATLSCLAIGESAPLLSWYRGTTKLDHGPTVSMSSKAFGYEASSNLTISLLSATTDDYHCSARYDDVTVTSSSATIRVLGVKSAPKDSTGVIGNDVVLECDPTEQTGVITWLHNGTDITGTSSITVTEGVSVLHLDSVTWITAGVYQCVVDYADYANPTYAAQPATLSVRGVTQSPESVITEEGSDVTLTCLTTGPPSPTITWYKTGGQDLGQGSLLNDYKSLLVLSSVDLTTTDDYKCVADYNDLGTHQSEIASLIVRGIQSHPVATTAVKTNTARFTCVIRGDKAPSSITWSRDDEAVDMTTASVATTTSGDDTTTVLTLTNVMTTGKYKCSAQFESPVGGVVSGSADLTVLEYTAVPQDTDTVLGYALTFTCKVHDNPASLKFYHNGTESVSGVTTNNNVATLIVEEVGLSSAGEYYCEVDYSPSLDTLGGNLDSSVAIVTVSSFIYEPEDVYVKAGNSADMSCRTTSFIQPIFTWKTGPVVTNDGAISVANWDATTLNDEGPYWCDAKFGDVGTLTSSTAVLYIRAIKTPPTERMVVLGHDAALTCEVHGKGLMLVTWLNDEEEVKVDSVPTATTLVTSVLELTEVTENKNYSCKATFADPDDEILSDLTLVYVDQIKSVTSSVTLVSGQSATLTCTADQDPTFSWSYVDTGDIISDNIVNTPGSSELILPGVTTNTSVQCHVVYPETPGYTLGGSLTSNSVPVIVNDISIHPKNRTVVIGYATTLYCAGNNEPAISWYKDTTLISSASPLVIESAQTSDQTSYYCSLTWEQGSLTTDKVRVTVLDILVHPMSGIAVDGGNTSASCSAPAPATFLWYNNDVKVDPDSDARYTITSTTSSDTSNTLLTITNATPDTDGSYACEAEYQPDLSVEFVGGKVRSNSATLTVYRIIGHPEDKFVLLENNITLSCQLNDSAAITWYHNDSPIGPGVTSTQGKTITSEFALSKVDWDDAGFYYCEGSYSQGKITSTPAKVFVRGIWEAPEPVLVVLDYPATFQCVSRGEAEITWSYGEVEMASSSSEYGESNWLTIASLTIDPISVRDPALVTCHVDYTSSDPMSIISEAQSITVFSVTEDPVDTVGIKTNDATMSCVASGNPTVTWQKDGAAAPDLKTELTAGDNSVTSQLFITDIKMSDAGQYKCVADYGGLGEHDSQPATLTVYELTKEPIEQAIEKSRQGEFICESNGVPDSVNWYKDGDIITDLTDISTVSAKSTLTLPSLEFPDKGNYKCEFVFQQGRISSSEAYLSVRGFYVEPTDSVGIQDNSVTFTCILHGESDAAITWQNRDTAMESLSSIVIIDTTYTAPNTTSILTLNSLQHGVYDDSSITCTADFSSPDLSLTSRVGKLTVLRILLAPVDTAAVSSLTATLTCKVDSSGVMSWYNGDELMEGESSSTLVFEPVTDLDQGQYRCRSTFPTVGQFVYGGVTSSAEVTLTVHRFTTEPVTRHVTLGSSTSLNCEGSGDPEIVWFKGTDEVQRGSSADLNLSDVTFTDDEEYTCTLVYPQGEISSAPVDIHVRGVSTSPSQGTAVLGQSVMFQCMATGDIQPTFKWTRNGDDINGESENVFESLLTTTTFSYAGVVEDDTTAEFRCIADFQGQTHQSEPASVTVLKVTTPPVGVYGVVGGAASFSCVAAGNPNPTEFSWLLGGVVVGVEDTVTNPSDSTVMSKITVSDLSREDHGDYTCVPDYPAELDNLFLGGTTESSPGKLSVIGLTEPPVQTIVKVGDTATFTCKANSEPVPTLSWFKSGSTITSGVSAPETVGDEVVSYLAISNVGDSDVAPYSCKADYPSLASHLSEDAFLRFRGIEELPLVTPAVIGKPNEMNCTARGEAEAEMKWLANGTEITVSEVYSIFVASNYSSDPAKQQDLIDTRTILTVSTVTLPIAFLEITCSATWEGSDGQASEVVSDPVNFDPLYVYKSPIDTIAVRYTTVELSCSATRTPLIRWDRSGRTYGVGIIDIDGKERTHSTLRIGNVTEADQGNIWCVAEYDGGMHDSDKAQLTVVGIRSEPRTQILLQRGLSVEFTCVVDRYPLNTVSWYKGDEKIQDYDNRKDMTKEEKDLFVEYKLSVSSVTEEDMGPYHCKVEYPQGDQISQPAYLQIREPAQITLIVATGGDKAGESIELLCQASGVPKPTITWRRSGKEFPSDETSSVVTIYNEPGSSLVLINITTSDDQGIYSCVASNGVGEPVIMETELVLESAVKVVTVASASSLLVFIIAVCTAVMLFALYRRRKRKNALHPEEDKIPPPTPVEDSERDLENHVYDNEASIFGEVKSCEDEDMDYESGIECDDDIPTVEPPDENPALFLMPDRTSKELPPLNRVPSASLSENPIFSVPKVSSRNKQLPSLDRTRNLPPLPSSIYENEFNINSDSSGYSQKAGLIEDDERTIGLLPNHFNEPHSSSPCPSGYMSGTDLTSSGGLPAVDERTEPTRRLSLLATTNNVRESPDPHVPSNFD
ncbi:hemicentin-1-like isoform X2 [Bolinopsis microptera]|uniref:hemicentin-1-like isoform X2 n=1 Tax=Bolinopsis microptera TaxID=2820187 RepID=UPI0030790FC1